MKIGMLSQWFDPEPGPASLPGVYAREMIRQGHEVSVLSGFPNYPHGRIYEGYTQRPRQSRMEGGALVTRVPLYPSHDSSAVRRAANYASFSLSALVLGTGALADADAVWVYNSPVTVALPLMAQTRMGDKPYFLHVQDLWPDSLMHSNMIPGGRTGRFAETVINGIVRLMERRAACIGVISPSVRELILQRNPAVDPARIVYVPNPTDETIFKPLDSAVPSDAGSFTVMYVGAIGQAQGLDTVLDAAQILRTTSDVQFVIVGDGNAKRRLEARAVEEGITNVSFRGRIDKESVPQMMASADAQLVTLADDDFLRFTTPSKISAIMASGLPIIAQLAGDGADLISDAGAGMSAAPGNAAALAEAVKAMSELPPHKLESFGQSGLGFYRRSLSTESSTTKILSAMQAAVQ